MKFNKRIRALREDADKTQTEIAVVLGMSQRRVSRLEKADIQPTLSDIEKYCMYFNKSADYILGYTDNPMPFNAKQ